MKDSTNQVHFAEPLQSEDPAQCQFYHRMSLPGVGEVGGQWDLRGCIEEYLGNYDFSRKRVLDVGTASGFLSFALEKRGAEVVSFDMDDGGRWDIVPQKSVRADLEGHMKYMREAHSQLKNAYWLAHRRLGSKARVYYGNIYDIPAELGPFDAAVMGMVISHVRDPFLAMYNVARLCTQHLIIINQIYKARDAVACFAPTPENQMDRVWWVFSEKCIGQMLAVMGFQVIRTVKSKPVCLAYGTPSEDRCVTFVARRVEA
jgi:SAM-dependent methyltransferase